MKIKIVTDSTCDLSKDYLTQNSIEQLPLKVLFGSTEYKDKIEISPKEFFQKLKEHPNLPSTSQVNPSEFHEVYEEILTKDEDVVIITPTISSELSGTFSSAGIAKNMLDTDRVFVFDTHAVSLGLGGFVIKINDLIKEGKSVEEIIKIITPLKEKSRLYAVLDTLTNLKKGGRLSASKALIGSILGVKPIIAVDEGKVVFKDKVRKHEKGLEYLIDLLKADFPDGKIPYLGIGSTNDEAKLKKLEEKIRASFVVDNLQIYEIGPVIGVHAAEGAIAIHYFQN